MKKLFFIAAIAGAALVSCTKNELAPSVTAQEEISFAAPVVGAQTKVYGAIGATYDTEESFDVWSVWNDAKLGTGTWAGTPYITDKAAKYVTAKGGWAFDPTYYWPADGYLSFVALSPSIAKETTYDATNGFKITAWSQGASETAIVDLMYSNESRDHEKAMYTETGDNVGEGSAYTYKGVDIMFNHALSYLVFKVKTKENYSATTKFQLTKITLSNICTTGDFQQKDGGALNSDPWTETTSNLGTYVAFDYDRVISESDPASKFGVIGFSSSSVNVPETSGKQIILLPQALVDDQQKLKINYQISTDNGVNWIDQEQEIDLYDGSIKNWEMGKKYTYTLSISMTEIILDPAVAVWDTTGSGTLDL